MQQTERFTTHITAKTGWFDLNLRELWQYRDLVLLFVKRNYTTRYKQTILGPLWLIFNPLITVSLYAFVFGGIAGLPTDNVPQFAFYLASNALWSYFALCITQTAATFTANAGVLGKVYFPRMVMPVSSVITGLFDLAIQVVMLAVVVCVYNLTGTAIPVTSSVFLAVPLVLQTALLGLGFGIIIASLTTKYRDLAILVTFGVQLWMYISPVVYSTSQLAGRTYSVYMCNPMAPVLAAWRYATLGTDTFDGFYWGVSWAVTLVVLLIGVLLFNRIEKTFMDTV